MQNSPCGLFFLHIKKGGIAATLYAFVLSCISLPASSLSVASLVALYHFYQVQAGAVVATDLYRLTGVQVVQRLDDPSIHIHHTQLDLFPAVVAHQLYRKP